MRKYLLLLSVWAIMMSHLFGQIEVSMAWESDTVIIGNEVGLTLSIEVESGTEVLGVADYFLDSIYSALASVKAQVDTSQPIVPQIADFEVVDLGEWQESGDDGFYGGEELSWRESTAGGKRLLENRFTLRLWDPGQIVAVLPVVIYDIAGEQDQYIREEQVQTFVAPPGGLMSQDSVSLADIKPILQEPVRLEDYIPYIIALGAAIILGLFYWWWAKRARRPDTPVAVIDEPEVVLPAHEIALSKLTQLREEQLWQKGDIKTYQSELTYVIREYLENRYEVQALESTTDEIVLAVQTEIESTDVISLKRILQVADLVKFARATPEENIHESFMNEAVDFVQRTKLTVPDES